MTYDDLSKELNKTISNLYDFYEEQLIKNTNLTSQVIQQFLDSSNETSYQLQKAILTEYNKTYTDITKTISQ